MQETELVSRVKLGDKAALEKIVEIYYGDIYQFLSRRNGDPFAAQDMTQDTFLKFTQSLSYYKDSGKLKSYLFTIAINCSNDYFRAKKDLPLESCEEVESGTNIQASFEASEQAEKIRSVILSLPDWQRDVVILRYYHDMKLKQIADVLEIPAATVKTRLHRANKALQEKLKGEGL